MRSGSGLSQSLPACLPTVSAVWQMAESTALSSDSLVLVAWTVGLRDAMLFPRSSMRSTELSRGGS